MFPRNFKSLKLRSINVTQHLIDNGAKKLNWFSSKYFPQVPNYNKPIDSES